MTDDVMEMHPPRHQRSLGVMRKLARLSGIAVVLVALSLGASPASAQTKAKPKTSAKPAATAPAEAAAPAAEGAAAEGEAPKVKVERGAGGKKVYRIQEEIRIEGKIQKPEAFYVLQKSSINYDWQEMKQQFLPKIISSVNNAPF